MAKKITEDTDEAPAPAPLKKKEPLIAVVAMEWFSDGNLQEAMGEYGYESAWRVGEERRLPKWLVDRCISSGAELEKVE